MKLRFNRLPVRQGCPAPYLPVLVRTEISLRWSLILAPHLLPFLVRTPRWFDQRLIPSLQTLNSISHHLHRSLLLGFIRCQRPPARQSALVITCEIVDEIIIEIAIEISEWLARATLPLLMTTPFLDFHFASHPPIRQPAHHCLRVVLLTILHLLLPLHVPKE